MPQTRVDLHPAAISEAQAAYRWYARRSRAAGEAFLAELDRAIVAIADQPATWSKHLHGTRRYLLRRFPYAIVYRESSERITVVAVAHGRRRPGYWRQR